MSWLDLAPFVAAAVVVVFGAGLLVTSAARISAFAKVASAPAVAIAVVAITAIVCPALHTNFGPWPSVVGFVFTASFAWGIRIFGDWSNRRRKNVAGPAAAEPVSTADSVIPDHPQAPAWGIWLAWGVALLLMVRHWSNILGRPDAFSQTYDNIFHMNAIRWILDTGQGSSLAFGMTVGNQAPAYYPTAWHDLVALVNMVVGSPDVALAVNAVTLVIMGLVWTSGCLFLVSTLTTGRLAVIVGAGVLSASFPGFPFLLLSFGVLYPNFLGMSLLPAGIALTVQVLRLQSGRPSHLWSSIAIGILVLSGIGLSHPNVLMSYLVILVPMLAASIWVALSEGQALGVGVRTLLFVIVLPMSGFAWLRIRPSDDAIWGPYLSTQDAFGSGVLFAAGRLWPAWPLALLTMVGVYAAFRWRRNRWLVIAHGLLLFLWMAAAAMSSGGLRTLLVGVWYADSYRLAALLSITGVPLAALGVEQLALLITGLLGIKFGRAKLIEYAVGFILVALLAMLTQPATWMNRAIAQFGASFALGPKSALVTSDEYAVIQAARSIVPADATIATDPWNGSSMVFALADRRTTTTHVTFVTSPDLEEINQHLDEAASSPAVCDAVLRLNVRYVLDFGNSEIHGGDHHYAGFDRLGSSSGFSLLVRQGDAALYQVTACR